jgi:hypothetical protein
MSTRKPIATWQFPGYSGQVSSVDLGGPLRRQVQGPMKLLRRLVQTLAIKGQPKQRFERPLTCQFRKHYARPARRGKALRAKQPPKTRDFRAKCDSKGLAAPIIPGCSVD